MFVFLDGLAFTPGKALCDTGGCDFPRLWQGWHPADQLVCLHVLPLLLFFVIYFDIQQFLLSSQSCSSPTAGNCPSRSCL